MRRLILISIVPLLVACSAPATSTPAAPKSERQPATATVASKPAAATAESKPTAAKPDSKPAAQPKAGTEAKPQPEGASELGRRFVQSLIAGDASSANALLADSARSGLGAKTPEYARSLAACSGSALDASVSQNQSMTNVLVRFSQPCGRFGDIAPLLPPGAAEPSEHEKKIGGCLVAFRSVNNELRVANFACNAA